MAEAQIAPLDAHGGALAACCGEAGRAEVDRAALEVEVEAVCAVCRDSDLEGAFAVGPVPPSVRALAVNLQASGDVGIVERLAVRLGNGTLDLMHAHIFLHADQDAAGMRVDHCDGRGAVLVCRRRTA